ncbi:MAG: M23 family metallopeptidase [Acidimicrobiales bacterium]
MVLLAMVLLVSLVWAVGAPGDVGANEAELQAARDEASAAAEAFLAVELDLEETELAIGAAERSIELTQADSARLRQLVAEEALNEYIRRGSNQSTGLGVDPNSQALASALSRAARGETRSRTDALASIKATLDRQLSELEQRRSEADRYRSELAARREALFQHLDQLEQMDAARKESDRVADQARREAEAAAALAAYEEAVRAQAAAGSGGSDGSDGSGGAGEAPPPPPPPRPAVPVDWLCPITGGYSFSDTWGAARSGGRSHRGTDIWADYGTPVVATVDGEAVDYGWDWAGGNGVFLLGDDGNRYYYAHLDSFGTLGRVSQGDVVGYVGDTGNASGTPHLHFEIHPGGSGWTNPYATLVQYC